MFVCTAWRSYRSNDFIVGLTNDSPVEVEPLWKNYTFTLCGKYPSEVPSRATVSLYCQDDLPSYRYVIVQFPRTDHMNVCEIEVLVKGTRMPSILSFQSTQKSSRKLLQFVPICYLSFLEMTVI